MDALIFDFESNGKATSAFDGFDDAVFAFKLSVVLDRKIV
jgi:hypothetical protein